MNFRNFFRKSRLFIVLLITAIIFTVIAAVGRNGIYSSYKTDRVKEPLLKTVFQGIHDGKYPWQAASGEDSGSGLRDDGWESVADGSGDNSGKESAAAASTSDSTQAAADTAGTAATAAASQEAASADTTLPDGVCSPVVQAKDYGIADSQYMTQDGHYNTDTQGLFAKNGTYYKLQSADADYLNNTLFIGDSRTVGLRDYGGISDKASFLAKESTTIYNLQEGDAITFTAPDGTNRDASLGDALSGTKYSHIYISVGVNELGTGNTQLFYDTYRKVIEQIHNAQPDAIIFIEGIQHVDQAKSSTDSVLNNTIIVQRNEAIATLANGRNIFYIDENAAMCDSDGNLQSDLTGDGIHLVAAAYQKWVDYILANAIVPG